MPTQYETITMCRKKKLIQAFKKFHKKELYGVKQSQEPQVSSLRTEKTPNSSLT